MRHLNDFFNNLLPNLKPRMFQIPPRLKQKPFLRMQVPQEQ